MTGNARQAELTQLLVAWREGSRESADELFSLVYDELRVIARRALKRGGGQTLGTTGLVHEGFLKLVDQTQATARDRAHFFAIASTVMRHILIDHARKRASLKRGGSETPEPLVEERVAAPMRSDELLSLDQALGRLESIDSRLGRLVEMRFFGGLSIEETAEALEVSPRTVKRDWIKARAFLFNELKEMRAP